ncbi:hypothetical protein SFC43_01315 [Bacteroides sp. CR5/BHMF/2]|nr:hypothetical protein [Bacteroides sp. CR5/BHMF/2]
MIRNIIKEKDEIKAYSFDRNGKIIASLYDSWLYLCWCCYIGDFPAWFRLDEGY